MASSGKFVIKAGDRTPSIKGTLTDCDGSPITDLASATSIAFSMERPTLSVVSGTATIADAAAGTVQYDWAAGDTDDVGENKAIFVVTWSPGNVQTFPSSGTITVTVKDTYE